ncbi:1795_t:CDS:2 [Racocetra persica]|uniref:1795_t:CDS:1 n=1 Tax=Racocetra persica TaxID=160502 RepID=A0ACA9KDN8_9GLOM|nr:1795_t:CDS:2 [Racocetra persica]
MEKHNEDDIDISTYFEETYCNETINNIFKDPEPVSLKKGDSFDNFEEAESHEQLVSFPNAKLYLERYLYERRFSWARAFTIIEFTLGIQSTSFVESQNAYIKRVLESSNTLLCDLASIVMVFPAIESLVESLTIYKLSQSKDVDDEPDAINLSAKYLLNHLKQNTVEEIWKLSRVTSSRINHFIFLLINGSYSCIYLLQQKKGLVCQHFFHLLNITEKAHFNL